MSGRILKGLLIVLGVLVLAYGVVRLVGGGSEGPASEALALDAGADMEIDSVVIGGPEDAIRLRGGASGWTVNGYEAVPDAGVSLADALEGARTGRLVSRNPANHERLGVSDATGRRVTFYSGTEPALTVVLGDAADTGGRYVRRSGEDEVYVLEGDLPRLVGREVDDWRNREIVNVGREEVARVELELSDTTFAIVRDTAGWYLEPGGARGDAARIEGLLSQVTSLRAIDFADDTAAASLDWEDPMAAVRLEGPGGAELARLLFLDHGDTGYYVKRSDRQVIYTIARFAGEQVLKRPVDLIGDRAEAGPEGGAE